MAEALGKRLRSELRGETLDSFLTDLLALFPRDPEPLCDPALDALINGILFPPPPPPPNPLEGSQTEAAAGAAKPPPFTKKTKDQPLVVEIASTEPLAGRTWLTLLTTARALLGTPNRPGGSAVVWIDVDGRLSIQRLYDVLLALLRAHRRRPKTPLPKSSPPSSPPIAAPVPIPAPVQAEADARTEPEPEPQAPPQSSPDWPSPSPSEDNDDDDDDDDDKVTEATESDLQAAKSALTHLHVFHPQTFASLLATLRALPGTMLATRTHFSGGRALSHLVLSGASALYWMERARIEAPPSEESGASSFEEEDVQPPPPPPPAAVEKEGEEEEGEAEESDSKKKVQEKKKEKKKKKKRTGRTGDINARYETLVLAIKDAQRALRCHALVTRWVGRGAPRLARAWEAWVDLRILLSKDDGSGNRGRRARFPFGVSVLEALEWDAERRRGGRRREEDAEEKSEGYEAKEGRGGKGKEREDESSRFFGSVVVAGKRRGGFELVVGPDGVYVEETKEHGA